MTDQPDETDRDGEGDKRPAGRTAAWAAAAGMGIGSAALVAALLYGGRAKAKPEPKPPLHKDQPES